MSETNISNIENKVIKSEKMSIFLNGEENLSIHFLIDFEEIKDENVVVARNIKTNMYGVGETLFEAKTNIFADLSKIVAKKIDEGNLILWLDSLGFIPDSISKELNTMFQSMRTKSSSYNTFSDVFFKSDLSNVSNLTSSWTQENN